MKSLLIMLVGLPRSGKSTFTRKLRQHLVDAVVVNADSIRLAMHGQRYQPAAEEMVRAVEMIMVKSLFLAGHTTIILDETSHTRARRDRYKSHNWDRIFVHVDTPLETCVERAVLTGQPDLAEVLPHKQKEFEMVTEDEGQVFRADDPELLSKLGR